MELPPKPRRDRIRARSARLKRPAISSSPHDDPDHAVGLRRTTPRIRRPLDQNATWRTAYAQLPKGHRLHEIAFLEQYKYFKSPQFLIKAKTTTLPTAQNFFSGKWLEIFVLQTVQKSVNKVSTEVGKELDFSYLINPQIILPNGNDFELDLIFHINGAFYWIEAKTGDFQQHISKYSKMSKMMGLDYKHSIMVLTDIQPDKSSALTSLFSMTVYGLPQLEIGLTETIRKDVNA